MSRNRSVSGSAVTAIAGVVIALYDLADKSLGISAYQLVGRECRDRVGSYCDVHAGTHRSETDTGD